MEPKILDTTSVCVDPKMGTLGANMIFKRVIKQGCKANLTVQTYFMSQPQQIA